MSATTDFTVYFFRFTECTICIGIMPKLTLALNVNSFDINCQKFYKKNSLLFFLETDYSFSLKTIYLD